jgi:hypothetical protein
MWLARRSDMPFFGELFLQDWAVAVAAYGIVLLHILGAPLLLWRRARIYVFIMYACFHTLNHFVFSIGIFPWLTLFATLIFFDPDWPKQLWRKLKTLFGASESGREVATGVSASPAANWLPKPMTQNLILAGLGIWLGYQVLMPLRHLLYPGAVSWTEEGHRYSWQMKLRDKQGSAFFYVSDPQSGQTWQVHPIAHMNARQARKMATRPDMILQFAHYLADVWRTQYNVPAPEVRVVTRVSLNGREPVPMIDPDVDLAKIERTLQHAHWILPLDRPLNRDPQRYRPSS